MENIPGCLDTSILFISLIKCVGPITRKSGHCRLYKHAPACWQSIILHVLFVPAVDLQRLLSPQLFNMDKISDEQKLEWLTTPIAPRKRALFTPAGVEDRYWQKPNYIETQLRRRIGQRSLGDLGKFPQELLCMVFKHLSCDDLEALHSCSSGIRIAVLSFPKYHRVLKHLPLVLAVLKETQLARSFTISKIYETFANTLCTNCGQFGGYVFLPSFARCCMHCAETELKFMQISRVDTIRDDERYMALTPLPCFIPKSASIETGLYCAGCAWRDKGHMPCRERADWTEYPCWNASGPSITGGSYVSCTTMTSPQVRFQLCPFGVARDRLYDSRHILSHLEGCEAAQVLLKRVVDWIAEG